MASDDVSRADEALGWVRRIHDPSFEDWEAHAAWLEADPANLAAFHEALSTIAAATDGLEGPRSHSAVPPIPINDNGPRPVEQPRRRVRWGAGIGMAVAAGLVAVVALPTMLQNGPRPYLLRTGPGEHRSIALADGTRIALNGASRLRLDRRDARVAILEQGEAFFTVTHDAAHPFAVRAGDATFQDVGTSFDVVHDAGLTRVAVREGAVLYDPAGAAVRLAGGQSIRIADHVATVQPVDTDTAGGWRSGVLVYRSAPLSDVASDLARSIGEPVSIDAALVPRRFTGVVAIDADRAKMFRQMEAVMPLEIRHVSDGWRMIVPPG